DFCCGGRRTLLDACRERGLDADAIARELELEADEVAPPSIDLAALPLDALCDHVEREHHAFLRRELPRLTEAWTKVARVHGAKHPECVQVARRVAELAEELEQHLLKEEMVLFPAIRGIASGNRAAARHCGSVRNPIGMMELEHDDAGLVLRELRALTDDYAVPDDACATYRAALDGLVELERDLHAHVHAENNVLFPRAVAAERGAS
ncbi:MAG: iron-sulfur cluster repair di-iron protein, partial [Planctomycetota bacterium]